MRDLVTIIAGSRYATEEQTNTGIALCPWKDRISVVLSGKCPQRWDRKRRLWTSADYWGEEWAKKNLIPVDPYPARYDLYDFKSAPVIRNTQMVNIGQALLLVWDGTSRGSMDVRKKALAKGLLFFEYVYRN